MAIVTAEKKRLNGQLAWILADEWGYQTVLPCLEHSKSVTANIGLLGTRVRGGKIAGYKWANNRTKLMAAMLLSVDKPIYLVDVRRTGIGGQGSWGPNEFANLIPNIMKERNKNHPPYSYIHLPIVAPENELLVAWRTARKQLKDDKDKIAFYNRITPEKIAHLVKRIETGQPVEPENYLLWQVFKAHYKRYLSQENRLNIAVAFVEATASRDGIVIFLCAEEYQPDFLQRTQEDQDQSYCHRYTLATQVAKQLASPEHSIKIHHFDLSHFREQWLKNEGVRL